jgi:hypothetical protein
MKVFCNIQKKLANQQAHIKLDVATTIRGMKKDIKEMMGNRVPEITINNIIAQLLSIAGEIESNFS